MKLMKLMKRRIKGGGVGEGTSPTWSEASARKNHQHIFPEIIYKGKMISRRVDTLKPNLQ
jgi:hypothetical protein